MFASLSKGKIYNDIIYIHLVGVYLHTDHVSGKCW